MVNETQRWDPSGSTLAETIARLSKAQSLPMVQEIVRQAARKLTNADGATFVLRDDDMCYYADEDAVTPLWKGQRFPMSKCVSGWSMIQHASVFIEDIYADPRVLWGAYRPTFVQSLAIAPIRRQSPVGAIGIYWAQRHAATQNEMEILVELAEATGAAMLVVDARV